MKIFKRVFLLFLTISLITVGICSSGFAGKEWTKDDNVTEEWSTIDLFIARPVGIAAGILGTGIFILSLPFTIPSGGVNDAADMFIVKPFKFSFVREFPDENM